MKFSTTRKSIQLYAEEHNLYVDIHQLEREVKAHENYGSALGYVDCLSQQDIQLSGLKISENNIDFMPFPMLCVLRNDHHGSILSYVHKKGSEYNYYKGDTEGSIALEELKQLWLGFVFYERSFLEKQEIYIEENNTNNVIALDPKSSFASVIGMRNQLHNKADTANVYLDIIGNDNHITFLEGSELNLKEIRIRGNHNRLTIGKDCRILGEFVLEGGNSTVVVGDETTVEKAYFSAGESRKISIGKDCMFSYEVSIQTSDSHSILDIETGKRINPAKDIVIEDHVWIAPDISVLKGVNVGDGSVIGIGSVVTKSVPKNSIAVGNPAKTIKPNITWDRDLL